MRRVALLAMALPLLFGVSQVHAAGYFDTTLAALTKGPVYVAPGTPGSTTDTANDLTGQLSDGDNLALVILPKEAETEYGDAQTFAKKLDDATGHKLIIGLAIGDTRIGYSTLLPASTASDLMSRAVSVSTSIPESLGTFARNVHNWQRQNATQPAAKPQPKPTPKSASKKPDNGFPWGWVIGIVGGLLAALLVSLAFGGSNSSNKAGLVEFHATPRQVRGPLSEILKLRPRVRNGQLRDVIMQMCSDIEAYFERYDNSGHDIDIEARTLHERAGKVRDVLQRYIDIQDHPRYYEGDQVQLLRTGSDAINEFAEQVLDSIKLGGVRNLAWYEVNTDILKATRV